MVQWHTVSVVGHVEDASQSRKRCLWNQQFVQTKVLLVSANATLALDINQLIDLSINQSVRYTVG